jgi:hypothetical protein
VLFLIVKYDLLHSTTAANRSDVTAKIVPDREYLGRKTIPMSLGCWLLPTMTLHFWKIQ